MTVQPVEVPLDLTGNYVDQINAASTATEGLQNVVSGFQARAGGMSRTWDAIAPSHRHIAAFAGFTTAAAYFQSEMAPIRTTAAAAGRSARGLADDVQYLARTMPIGTQGAVQMVQTVQALGVGAGSSRSQVRGLATDLTRLEAANNAMGSGLGLSFGQLNRQMANLDPQRLSRFGDVLTRVSAQTGASANGITDFARNIAPMAQQAGIGETAVLGISAAFVKLGDDGYAAGTAVNKILGDLNRSVREGSNDMAAYAQIVGMTSGQFRQMYQANPTQALTRVVTAIGQAGPQGQMQLESLGLEGVRTQSALLRLSQSGGLGAAIASAQSAYGSGATNAAAKQAFGGLENELTMFRTTIGQTADALGGPFLGAVTKVVHFASLGMRPLNAVLGTSPVQHGLEAVGGMAVTALLARRIAGPLGMLAFGRQLLTSGPARSLAGSYAFNRAGANYENALAMRSGRFGEEAMGLGVMNAPYGATPTMQRMNARFAGFGRFLGQTQADFMGAYQPGGAEGGNFLRRGIRGGLAFGTMGVEAYQRSVADPYVMSRLPASQRRSLLQPAESGLFSRAAAARSAVSTATEAETRTLFQRQVQGAAAAMGLIEKEGGTTAAMMTRLASSTGGAVVAMGRFAGETTLAGAKVVGRAGAGAVNMLGGVPGIAMMAGFGGYELYKNAQSQDRAITSSMQNMDVYQVQDSWRDAVGAASKSAMTMADAMKSATDTINAGVKNFPAARTVSQADILAAGSSSKFAANRASGVLNYTLGGTAAQTALIQASALGGMTPQDMQGVKEQMLKQGMSQGQVNAVLAGVKTTGSAGRLSGATVSGLGQAYAAAVASYDRHGHKLTDTDVYAGTDATKVMQAIGGSIGQQQASLTQQFGSRYATQQTLRTVQQLINQTPKYDAHGGISKQRLALTHALAASFGSNADYGARDMQDFLSMSGVSIGGMSGRQLQGLMNSPALQARLQPSIMEAPLRGAGAYSLLPFFTARTAPARFQAGQRAANYVAAGHEQDISALTKATSTMVDAAVKSGTSLSDLAVQAGKASSATAGWQQQLMEMVLAQAQFRQQTYLQGATRASTWQTTIGSDLQTIAAGPGVDPQGAQAQAYTNARNDLQQRRADIISYYQQRLMAQFQYQIQSQRSAEDYQRSTGRAEQDFYRQRGRALRDFNIQRQREIQDAATQDYSIYTRIQTQPTWDAVNLLGNAREQLQAMRGQVQNIHILRGLGLSEAALRMLDAYNPQNAQQIQQLVYDLRGNSGLVAQYDQVAAARERAAGGLLGMSTTFQRQRADFQRGLRDTRSDFNLAMGRQRTDYMTAMQRAAEDLHNSDMEITNDLEKLQKNMQQVVNGNTVNFKDVISNNMQDALDIVRHRMGQINGVLNSGKDRTGSMQWGPRGSATANSGVVATGGVSGGGYGNAPTGGSAGGTITLPSGKHIPDPGAGATSYVRPGTGKVYTGPTVDNELPSSEFMRQHPADKSFNKSIAAHMRPGWFKDKRIWQAWQDLWETESHWSQYAHNPYDPNGYGQGAYGIPQAYPGHKLGQFGRDWKTNPATQIAWGIHYISSVYGDPLTVAQRQGLYTGHYKGYEMGGIATKPHLARVAEGPDAEIMIPLNQRGAHFLVDAMRMYVSSADAAKIATGGMGTATYVTDNSRHYHDHRTDLSGSNIEVKANTPRELALALEAKSRADNLTATRGVSW